MKCRVIGVGVCRLSCNGFGKYLDCSCGEPAEKPRIPPLFIIGYLCPQSPWWLVRQGRNEDAEAALRRLNNQEHYSDEDNRNTVAMMNHTTELERKTQSGTTYIDCFRGTDRRRTEIVMVVFAMQILSGQSIVGQGIQFLQRAGISTDLSFTINLVLQSMFMLGTIFSWGREFYPLLLHWHTCGRSRSLAVNRFEY